MSIMGCLQTLQTFHCCLLAIVFAFLGRLDPSCIGLNCRVKGAIVCQLPLITARPKVQLLGVIAFERTEQRILGRVSE